MFEWDQAAKGPERSKARSEGRAAQTPGRSARQGEAVSLRASAEYRHAAYMIRYVTYVSRERDRACNIMQCTYILMFVNTMNEQEKREGKGKGKIQKQIKTD